MQHRAYGPVEAWIGFKLKIDPAQLEPLSAGGGGHAWANYRHPELGIVTIHPDDLYSKSRTLFHCGFESPDCQAFVRGFCGEKPFPTDKRGKDLYSEGMKAEVQAREKKSELEVA